ncbi:autoinducer binding domain-containing protein [Jannaschia pohangensis]|uniref:LuxR family transcriptional regulator n=1 Tax=Jannaschia pohangensis TaxID=390807 RepID=A0A1I3RWJ9_9RHOB|nr:autoinducer binding domain-containing protein [Jannaschia pohangensis]SFJ50410.1 LuxR family transcriptional regulator [Jannaschia pohangensis]
MFRYLQRLEELAPMGYQAGVHIRFASPLFMRSTYPQEWQELYSAQNYALRDPLVFWGVSRSGAIRWSEITLPDPFGVMQKAADFGLTYGVVVSCGKITSRTIVGVARADREFTDGEIAEVSAIADALHEVAEPPQDMTPELLEALRLAGLGVNQVAAAEQVGISEGTMKSRLSTARVLLGATTTAEAIKMAKEYRLI